MTSPWTDGEDLTAALMYARTTALITALQTGTATGTWTTVTAASGFTGVSFQARLDGNGDVRLRGRVNKNSGNYTAGSWTTVGTLPAGYDPAIDYYARVHCANADFDGGIRVLAGALSVEIYAPTGSAVAGYYVYGPPWAI